MAEFHGFEVIETDKIEQYKNRPGVWAMLGIEKRDERKNYVCLNVGKNVDVGGELAIDLERLNDKKFKKSKPIEKNT